MTEAANTRRQAVAGALTFATVPALYQASGSWFQGGVLILDLGGVERTDSAGLALFIEWRRRARARGMVLRFEQAPAQVHNFIRENRLGALLEGEAA